MILIKQTWLQRHLVKLVISICQCTLHTAEIALNGRHFSLFSPFALNQLQLIRNVTIPPRELDRIKEKKENEKQIENVRYIE